MVAKRPFIIIFLLLFSFAIKAGVAPLISGQPLLIAGKHEGVFDFTEMIFIATMLTGTTVQNWLTGYWSQRKVIIEQLNPEQPECRKVNFDIALAIRVQRAMEENPEQNIKLILGAGKEAAIYYRNDEENTHSPEPLLFGEEDMQAQDTDDKLEYRSPENQIAVEHIEGGIPSMVSCGCIFSKCSNSDGDTDTEPEDNEQDDEEEASPEVEAASEPRGETASEPGGETASEPRGETASEPRGETASEPRGKIASEPRGKIASELGGEIALVVPPAPRSVELPEECLQYVHMSKDFLGRGLAIVKSQIGGGDKEFVEKRKSVMNSVLWAYGQKKQEMIDGSTGVVSTVKTIYGTFAVKVPTGGKSKAGKEEVKQYFQTEITALCQLRHRNIINLYGIIEVERAFSVASYMLILEYGGTDMQILMGQQYEMVIDNAFTIACQLLQGLSYIHDQSFLMRDIKPENIVLMFHSQEIAVKYVDFGTVCRKGGGNVWDGTEGYKAPELIGGTGLYSQSSDIFSLGVVFGLLAECNVASKKICSFINSQGEEELLSEYQYLGRDSPDKLSVYIAECFDRFSKKRLPDSDWVPKKLEECRLPCEEVPALVQFAAVLMTRREPQGRATTRELNALFEQFWIKVLQPQWEGLKSN